MYVYRLDDGGREGEEEDWAKKEKNFTIINHLVILEAETDSLYAVSYTHLTLPTS